MKYPTPGQVKTRLAASLGAEAASKIARVCTELTLERLTPCRRESVLCVDPPEAMARTRRWLGVDWPLQPQHGATLGARLRRAMQQAFAEGAARVLIIGTDSPWLRADEIEHAFAALTGTDLVVGPTDDGGYYLIGLSRPAVGIFEGIAWSSPSVLAETMTKARGMGLRVHMLAQGYDLDHLDDVQRFLADDAIRGAHGEAVAAIEQWCTRREACSS